MAAEKNRKWVWVFVALVVLGVAAISINWVYNARQQLTLDELHRQRELWDRAGPRDYLLETQMGGGWYAVQVRNGRVESALYKATSDAPGQPLRADQYDFYTMPGLFDIMQRNLERDAQPRAPRASNRAEFDPENGRLIMYRRAGRGEEKPVIILVKRFEPGPP